MILQKEVHLHKNEPKMVRPKDFENHLEGTLKRKWIFKNLKPILESLNPNDSSKGL